MSFDQLFRAAADVLASFLAVLFLTAAWSKARDLGRFTGVVADYDLAPLGWSRPLALALPVVEIVVAVLLLTRGMGQALGALAAAALLLVFAGAMAANLRRGRSEISCGCGGPAEPIGAGKVALNIALAGAALGVAVAPDVQPSVADRLASWAGGLLLFCCWGAAAQARANHRLMTAARFPGARA